MRVETVFVAVLLALAHANVAEAAALADCVNTNGDIGAIDCSGSASNDTPGTGPIRRSTGVGTIDPKVLELQDLLAQSDQQHGVIPTSHPLYQDVCLSGRVPRWQTENICWTATPIIATPQTPDPQQQAQAWVDNYFKQIPLPKPEPTMSSPDGVCGAVHYLDLRIQDEFIFQATTPLGPLTLHAYGMALVDWGDGTTNSYTSTGSPGTTSEISHFWTHQNTYTINAMVSWSADWTIGTEFSGTVTGATTLGTRPNWNVVDLQAVITKG